MDIPENDKKQIAMICKRCVDCKFVEINDSGTRYNCEKNQSQPISSLNEACKDFEKIKIVKTKSEPLSNEKHESFCQHYIIDFNAAEAARQTGYSVKTARTIGSKLLTNVDIQDRVQALIAERNEKVEITQQEVLKDLRQVKDRCMQSTPMMVWDHGLKQYVPKTVVIEDEDGEQVIATVYQFDAHNAVKALDLLGKHTGIYDKDNKQKTGNVTIFQLPDNNRGE